MSVANCPSLLVLIQQSLLFRSMGSCCAEKALLLLPQGIGFRSCVVQYRPTHDVVAFAHITDCELLQASQLVSKLCGV